jgi:hypothetical protein
MSALFNILWVELGFKILSILSDFLHTQLVLQLLCKPGAYFLVTVTKRIVRGY